MDGGGPKQESKRQSAGEGGWSDQSDNQAPWSREVSSDQSEHDVKRQTAAEQWRWQRAVKWNEDRSAALQKKEREPTVSRSAKGVVSCNSCARAVILDGSRRLNRGLCISTYASSASRRLSYSTKAKLLDC